MKEIRKKRTEDINRNEKSSLSLSITSVHERKQEKEKCCLKNSGNEEKQKDRKRNKERILVGEGKDQLRRVSKNISKREARANLEKKLHHLHCPIF